MLDLVLSVSLLALTFVIGSVLERRHYASIRQRERELADILTFSSRFPPDRVTPQHAFLVTGTVVVSSDYFKVFVAGLRKLVGGRFRAYETLLERARREALLRLKSEARRRGAKLVVSVRFESTALTGKRRTPSFEIFAYGTALVLRHPGEGDQPPPPKVSRLLGDGLAKYPAAR